MLCSRLSGRYCPVKSCNICYILTRRYLPLILVESPRKFFSQFKGSYMLVLYFVGAHTLGVARCSSFKNRLVDAVDPNLDSGFAKQLTKTCSAGDNTEQPFDATRNHFDNLYFNALQHNTGLLASDQTLFSSARTRNIVNGYAFNQAMFFFDFQQAMVKMSMLDVKEGFKGEVRQNCRKIN